MRQWLIQNDFQGLPGQTVPEMTDQIVQMVSDRYIELYERITGLTFMRNNTQNIEERIYNNVLAGIEKINVHQV